MKWFFGRDRNKGKTEERQAELEVNPLNLERLLSKARLGSPVALGEGAATMPLYIAKGYDLIVVSWGDAYRQGIVRVETTGGISGAPAQISNFGDSPVLMPQGVVFSPRQSGPQSRMSTKSIIVPPRQTISVNSLQCTYISGGIRAAELNDVELYAFPSSRIRIENQAQLWRLFEDVGESGIFDDVESRKNLAALLGSANYNRQMGQFVDGLKHIPSIVGGETIFGHLIAFVDPTTNNLTYFLEGFGNPKMYAGNQASLNKGIAGQGVVSNAAAQRMGVKAVHELRNVDEVITAFSRAELNNLIVPSAEYGTKVYAALYEGKPVHFQGAKLK